MKEHSYIGFLGLAVAVVVVISFFPSCREKTSISNQIVVTAMGIDQNESGVTLTVQAVEALKTSASLSEQSQAATGVYRASGPSIHYALQGFLNETGRSTYILHNQLIVIGEKTVKEHSLYDTLDFFLRNLESRALVDVIICRNDPKTVLELQSENDAIPAEYVAQMLKEGQRLGVAVKARLLDVQQTAGGQYDMVAPIINVADKTPYLDGTAVFNQGCVVGELTQEETTSFLYAANEIDTCLHSKNGVTLRVSSSSTRLSFETDGKCHIQITGRVEITESEKTLTQEIKGEYVKAFEEELERRVKAVMEKVTNEYKSDPLALVRRAQHASKRLDLQEARFTVTANMQLTESGFTT